MELRIKQDDDLGCIKTYLSVSTTVPYFQRGLLQCQTSQLSSYESCFVFGEAAVSILVPEVDYTEVALGSVSFSAKNAETTSRNSSH